ncbi:MAG TPA: SDR family NAD(P)-dependent oxidoreductase [Thermoleophilia bacterium]|nr:SDR family NAD(P)-dependent oxidoreductase [Thermoleophilia bacterium]
MGTDLGGRVVLVTGASIGIGREIALRFAAAGCRLALTYFEHRAEAEEVAARCRGLGSPDVALCSLQLADEDSIRTVVECVIDRFAAVDVMVNNAGVISWKPFLEQDFGEVDDQVNVNLLGVMKLTWCFLPLVADAVITIGSTAALHQSRTPPTYCATKWGLRGFVKALALEHPDKRMVSVHPTVTATRMNDMHGMSPERVAEVVFQVASGDIEVEPGGDVDLRDFVTA